MYKFRLNLSENSSKVNNRTLKILVEVFNLITLMLDATMYSACVMPWSWVGWSGIP